MTNARIPSRSYRTVLCILAVFLATGITSLAQESTLELNPAQTQIHFTVGSTLHTVHGTFKLKHGTVRFDQATGKISGSIVVDVTSGESGDTGRDKKMHEKVLQSQQFPEAVFTPTAMTGTLNSAATSEIRVNGQLALHGANHEMNLVFHVDRSGDVLTAKTEFEIPYIEWGMKNPSTLILRVSNKVEMEISAQGRLTGVGKP